MNIITNIYTQRLEVKSKKSWIESIQHLIKLIIIWLSWLIKLDYQIIIELIFNHVNIWQVKSYKKKTLTTNYMIFNIILLKYILLIINYTKINVNT